MSRKTDSEKEFSQNLDRMLAGEKPEENPALGDDYLTALGFARKLIDLRSAPPPEFAAKLEKRLLSRLADSQNGARTPSFWERWSSLLSKPVWRTAMVASMVIVISAVVIWGVGTLPSSMRAPQSDAVLENAQPPEFGVATAPKAVPPQASIPAPTPAPTPPPMPSPPPPPSLDVSAVTDKPFYFPGEEIEIKLSFTNITGEPLTLSHFPPYTEISRRGILLRTFDRGTQDVRLAAGETVTHSLIWDQLDREGKPVSPALYEVDVEYITLTKGSSTVAEQESYNSAGSVNIQYPQGAMEKALVVNQSRTANNITITLERVEMSSAGMKVYAFNTPPDYGLPQGTMLPPPEFMIAADAEYSIDNGAIRKAGPSAFRLLDDGMIHTWDNLDPVPSNASELTFSITKLGDWQGPWEFHIELQQ